MDRNGASSGNKVRFKQLVMADMAYDLHTIQYGYDGLSRLLSADLYPGHNVNATPLREYAYSYDPAGNRLSESLALNGGAPPVTNFSLDASALGSERVAIAGTISRYTRWRATRSGSAGETVKIAVNLIRF